MAIAKGQDFFAPNPQDIDKGNYLVFETDRQAEILDWLGCKNVPTVEKDRFIHSLINFNDNCSGFFEFRAYFLAAKYLAAFPNSSFADEIAEQLLDWSQGNFWCSKSKIDFNQTIAKEADKALKITDCRQAISAYEQTIQNTQQDELLISTAQKLLELAPKNQIAIATIKDRLANSDSNSELSYLVSLCSKYKIITSIAIETSIKLLKQIKPNDLPEADAWVGNTFYYLNEIAVNNENTIDALIVFLKRMARSNGYSFLIELALQTLSIIAQRNGNAIEFLESFIEEYAFTDFNHLSARALWTIDPDNFKAVYTALKFLDNENRPLAAQEVAYCLLEDNQTYINLSDKSLNKVVSYLIDLIYQDYQFQQKHRERAELVSMNGCYINILGKIAQTNKTALEGLCFLLEKVRDEHSKMFIYLALPKAARSSKALNIIYSLLESIKDDWQQYNIARKILVRDPNNKVALDIYHRLLNILDDKHSRLEIAKKLALSDSSNKVAINTLSELIYIPSLHNCLNEQELALPVLEPIDPSNRLAIKALEEFAKKTKDRDALIYIIKHLKRLDPGNDVAQKRLNRIIAAVINSMQTHDRNNDTCLMNVAIYWREL
ncbi:hypothetical protein [Myxosarcina sp. GI1]|uniref:hypothetical protein n=1 Tax=Myxosarcina sp. GI1 TaxID=1541065 RepID=UPI00055B04DA|nr:hypothetical protein [Myxosarcina sp. GI1]